MFNLLVIFKLWVLQKTYKLSHHITKLECDKLRELVMPRVKSQPRYKGPTPFELLLEEYLEDPLKFNAKRPIRPVIPGKGKGTKDDPVVLE